MIINKKNVFSFLILFLFILFFINNSIADAAALLADDFTGTTINTAKWTETDSGGVGGTVGNIQQNDYLTLSGSGAWGANYLLSVDTYDRSSGNLSMEFDLTCSSTGIPGIGYGDPGVLNGGGESFTMYIANRAVYFSRQASNSNVENGTIGFTCTAGTPFHVKISIGATTGASIYINGSATASKTLTGGTFDNKGFFLTSHSESTTLDNLEINDGVATVPDAPTSLSASVDSSQIALSWTAPSSNGGASITDYVVEYKLASSGTWLTFADGTSTATSATVTGLTNGQSYNFRVSATNSVGTGAVSSTATETPQVSSLTDDFTGTTIDTAKWTEVDDGGVGGTVGAVRQNGTLDITPNASGWNDQDGVSTVTTFDRTNGDVSMELSISRDACGSAVGSVAFGYGDIDFTTAQSASYILLTNSSIWELYYWDGGANQTGSPQTLSGLSSCTNGVPITFKIVAHQAGGASMYVNGSSTASATISGGTFTNKSFWMGGFHSGGTVSYDDVNIVSVSGPDAPTNLTASAGGSQIALSWTAPGDNGYSITDYVVEYKLASSGTWLTFADGTSTATSATVTGLTNGQSYNFRVSATNSVSTGNVSSSVTATPISSTPTAPTTSSVSISGSPSVSEQLTGTYSFVDVNGDSEATSVYRWLIADTAGGTYSAISGATSINYTIVSSDVDKYIKFEVTPVADTAPTTGVATISSASSRIDSFDYINQILSTGQSLSVGVASSPALTTSQPYDNLMLTGGSGGLGSGTSLISLVEASVETISSSMANTITANDTGNDYDVAVSLHGVSGYTYSQLKQGTVPYNKGISQVTNTKNAATALSRVSRVIGVTTIHGETDNYNDVSGSDYQGYLEEWQSDYETDIKAITGQTGTIPLFLGQMSSYMCSYANDATSEIPIYQLKAAEDNPGDIVLVTPKYFFNYSDRHHLTSASSRWLGEYYGKVIGKVAIDRELWRPLSTDSVVRNDNIIYAKFHVPSGELVFDTTLVSARTNYGFEYYDSTASASISSVEILNSETVKVTLSATPTGSDQKLRYAYTGVPGTNTGSQNAGTAAGNLRDTDSASSIYGNTLYNWAVHFDKDITVDSSAPVISNTSSVPSSVTAAVTWTTDEVSSSVVEYGLTDSYGTSTSESDTVPRVTSHDIDLSSLLSCTTYHYRVKSKDLAQNEVSSSDGTFITSGCTGSASVEGTEAGTVVVASGGTLNLDTGTAGLSLVVPIDFTAVASSVEFQLNQLNTNAVILVTGSAGSGSIVGNHTYELVAMEDLNTLVSNFDQPLTITVTYTNSEIVGLEESSLAIYYWTGTSWTELDSCSVDTSANTVSCTTTHFTTFGVFGTASVPSTSGGVSGSIGVWRKNTSPSTVTTTKPSTTTTTSTSTGVSKFHFTRNLKLGMSGNDVKKLQEFLNSNTFKVAMTGVGSKGNETEYFGNLTKQALIRFQNHYRSEVLTPVGLTQGTGYFGQSTIKFANSFTGTTSQEETDVQANIASPLFNRGLKRGMTNDDVRRLQQLLATLPNIYPEAIVSGYFGSLTEKAVQRFQLEYNVVKDSSDVGYGYVGPMTRGRLNGI